MDSINGAVIEAISISDALRPRAAYALAALGHTEASRHALDQLVAKHSKKAAYQIAQAFSWVGNKERAFEWLQRAYDQHDSGMTILKLDPLLKTIRGDARYSALLEK